MANLVLSRPRGFQLSAAQDFFRGFVPGSGMAVAATELLTLAFRLDRTFEPVAVAVREEGDELVCEVSEVSDMAAVERQIARILGLEADAEAWAAVGERDPVVGRLQRSFPGFFTAAKSSPYDAAVWSIISPRMNMRQAARIKIAMALELGDAVTLGGVVHHVFPAPDVLREVQEVRGLSDEKVLRLRGIGDAAMAGLLDVDRLRAAREDVALQSLQSIRGIGPWSAGHIYYRGAAPLDALPTAEPRVLRGLAAAYGIEAPDLVIFERLAENWRPFRMWVCVLLSRHLARTGGWKAPGLGRERAAAGRALARRTNNSASSEQSARRARPLFT